MICASIGERTVEACLSALRGHALAEIRLDRLRETSPDLRRLFAAPATLIATCRPGGGLPERRRRGLLHSAVRAGAAVVDVELDSAVSLRRAVIAEARKWGREVIVSFHDYERTPTRWELDRIVRLCLAAGADIAKIACRVNTPRDNLRLLSLLDCDERLVVVGMGPKGRLTRLLAPLFGSELSYGSASAGAPLAPGQPTVCELKKMGAGLEALLTRAGAR
jgi:3-dehydroquinate dehydratase I